ncbi:MAG: FkbM family methyltransferase [Bdellovibrionales bacterium]|nr:FkbM family methyltransferase [Bdellovibrionales bacterium]
MRYFGQFEPPVDKFIYERYFKYLDRKGSFIECGAFDGISESSCYIFEALLGWSAINVEPSPIPYQTLKLNRPNSININKALSNRRGQLTFKLAIHPTLNHAFGNSSLSHSDAHLRELEGSGCTFENILVETVTYDDLITEVKLKSLDLFVLDVEGHEINVLESMRDSRLGIFPTVFVVEHGHLGVEKLREIIEPLGYLYDVSSHVNSYFVRTEAGGHVLRSMSDHDSQLLLESGIKDLTSKFDKLMGNLILERDSLRTEIIMIKSSPSWKLTIPLRFCKKVFKSIIRKILRVDAPQ